MTPREVDREWHERMAKRLEQSRKEMHEVVKLFHSALKASEQSSQVVENEQ